MSARRIAALALILLSIATVPPSFSAAQGRREVRIGVIGVPATLDPAVALEGTAALIARHVYDTLLSYREGSTDVESGLATRWNVSRDGLTWTFAIRDNARFHDGTPLSAQDVAASFARQMRPDGETAPGGPWAAMLRGVPGIIKDVRATDARTVQILLAQPYAPLLTVLAHPALAVTRRGHDPAHRFIGSGPFRVVDATAGRLALEAVPGHWSGPSRAERIVFLEIGNDDHAEAEFDARSLDVWLPAGPPRRADWALSIPGLKIGYLTFQTEKEPFSQKRIRQAVAAALDPGALAVALERSAVPLQSFVPLGVWARREGHPVLGGTREQVKKLLTDGGWPAGYRPSLLIGPEGGLVNMAKVAETVAATLGASDIPVTIRRETPTGARTALQAGEYEIALTEAAVIAGDPHLLLFPLSTSEGAAKGPKALNFSFYRNPRLDDALIRASQLAFRAERLRLYHRAQIMLAEEMPWVPIFVRLQWAVVRPDVRGLRLHPTGLHRLDALTLSP